MKHTQPTRLLCLLLCALIGALFLTACSDSGKSDGAIDKVTLTYVQAPLNVPSIVEKTRSSFETAFAKEGVSMAYSELTSGADQTAALASGDIQLLNNVGGASVILSAAGGADIQILSIYCRAPKAFKLFAWDAGITSPADLKGKTIAGPKGTTLHELLAAYLQSGGLTLADVNFVAMDIPSARAALEGGSTDIALLAGPNAYQAEQAGFHVVTNGEGLITGTSVTATTKKFYKAHKNLVDAFLSVQRETLAFMESSHDEAMQMTANATDLELSAVEDMYTLYDFNMEIQDSDIASLKATQDFLLQCGMLENTVDIDSLFAS